MTIKKHLAPFTKKEDASISVPWGILLVMVSTILRPYTPDNRYGLPLVPRDTCNLRAEVRIDKRFQIFRFNRSVLGNGLSICDYIRSQLRGWIWEIDWVSICFSGKYVVVNGRATQNDVTQIYESMTGREVGARWSSYGHPSHYDLGIDQNGDDVAVGVAKSSPNQGRCIMRRLKDGEEKALCPAGSHTGTRNTHRPGWAYIQSTHKDLYVDEVIAVELTWDTKPIVERLGYIPNVKVDYLSETHGAVSFDGKKFCAVSNWGIADGQIQAYVVDITDLCSSTINMRKNFHRDIITSVALSSPIR